MYGRNLQRVQQRCMATNGNQKEAQAHHRGRSRWIRTPQNEPIPETVIVATTIDSPSMPLDDMGHGAKQDPKRRKNNQDKGPKDHIGVASSNAAASSLGVVVAICRLRILHLVLVGHQQRPQRDHSCKNNGKGKEPHGLTNKLTVAVVNGRLKQTSEKLVKVRVRDSHNLLLYCSSS